MTDPRLSLTLTHTHTRTRKHTQTHAVTHAHTHTHTHKRKHTQTHAVTHTRSRTHKHTHARTLPSHTHTHTHTLTEPNPVQGLSSLIVGKAWTFVSAGVEDARHGSRFLFIRTCLCGRGEWPGAGRSHVSSRSRLEHGSNS